MTNTIQVKRYPITPEVRDFIFKRDNYTCRYCGTKTAPFHLDHVYPVSKGGETTEENLVTSCSACNLQKHTKIGIYPKPIGYFEKDRYRKFYLFLSNIILGVLTSVLFLFAMSEENILIRNIELIVGCVCWIPALKEIILSLFEKE